VEAFTIKHAYPIAKAVHTADTATAVYARMATLGRLSGCVGRGLLDFSKLRHNPDFW